MLAERPKTLKAAKRMNFTKAALDELLRTRPQRQYTKWDTGSNHGLCVLVSRGPLHERRGTVTFRVCYYLPSKPGKPRYVVIGRYPDGEYKYPYKDDKGKVIVINCSNIEDVRTAASDIRNRAKRGIDPKRAVSSTAFAAIVGEFMEGHAKNNRSWNETQRIFDRYVLPEWGDKDIIEIKRRDVALLLDKIEQAKIKYKGKKLGGPLTASATLAQISKLFNWHASRSDDFISPIVKGMHRGKPQSRSRVLSDGELRALWPLLDGAGVYGAVIKCALLTAQRFHKVSSMRRADLKDHVTIPSHYDKEGRWIEEIHVDNVWDAVRDDDSENKQVSVVPLSEMARKVIADVPVIDADWDEDWVFSLNGRRPIKGWSKFKDRLDAAMQEALRKQAKENGQQIEWKPWQHRDLRRTAKTLMARSDVSRFISERCLAHVLTKVEGTYDRYDYLREKREAFERLAGLVNRIVNPPEGGNVIPWPERINGSAPGSSAARADMV